MTAAEFNAAVDYLCDRARAKEVQFDALRTEADRLSALASECNGGLAESRLQLELAKKEADRLRDERDRLWSTWAVVGSGVAGVVAGGLAIFIVTR